MSVKILIVNYRSVRYLKRCLDSLEPFDDCEITVVDNGSGCDEVEQIQRHIASIQNVSLVTSPVNLGFGAGVNLAAQEAGVLPSDEVWVLNPDTTVDSEAAETLKTAIRAGKADIVSPLITSGPEDDPWIWFAGGGMNVRSGKSYHSLFGQPIAQAPKGEIHTDFVTGAAPMFRGDVWIGLGGFREDLFLYWEDAELSIRARAMGHRLMLVPQARVWHKEGGSGAQSNGLSATYYYYVQRNRLIVCGQGQRSVRIALVEGLLETTRLLLKPLVRERHDKLAKFIASSAGLVAGLRGETGQAAVQR